MGPGTAIAGLLSFRPLSRPGRHGGGSGRRRRGHSRKGLGPPCAREAFNVLGGYIYKASQVAVLLLAAGTILVRLVGRRGLGPLLGLGPAKEVWALISLLVYLAFCAWPLRRLDRQTSAWPPGRSWGATAITMAWYGVNYYLRTGLHSYALGAGGQMEVGLFLLGNWIFLLAALARYRFETS